MGESQEDDRKQIAEMVLNKMGVQCVQPMVAHTNGLVESTAAAEKSSDRREERKEKSLPGPVQRGPRRRISGSQDSYDSTASSGSTSSITSATSRNSRDSRDK